MPVKHSLNILISKYSVVFKVIIYYFILMLVLVSIAASIVSPILADMYAEIQETGVTQQITQFFDEFLQGDSSVVETFGAIGSAFNTILDIVKTNNAAVTKGLVVIGVFSIVFIYLVAFANLVSSDVINNFMSSNLRFGFISDFVLNLGRSALYGLLYLVTYFPATLLSIGIVIGITYLIWSAGLALLALPVGVLLFLAFQSLVLTVFGGWLPAIVADKMKVAKALVEGPKRICKHFVYCWMSMFIAMFLGYIFVAICTIVTFGAGVILAFPTVVVAVKILELVLYYNASGYKFYETTQMVTEENIPTND